MAEKGIIINKKDRRTICEALDLAHELQGEEDPKFDKELNNVGKKLKC